MALRELPLLNAQKNGRNGHKNGSSNGYIVNKGRYGAAHEQARDAYRNVPILQKPTWGHEIAAYFYLGGVSSGAYIISALAELCGGERMKSLSRTAHYVAFATMLPCAPLLIADLGKPSRFHHMLRIFKPSSPMNLGAWALTAHGAMSTLTTARALAAEDKLPVIGPLVRLLPAGPLVAGGMPSALTLGGYTGVLIGTSSTPVWFKSPLLGALFMSSAMSTGTAASTLASMAAGRDTPEEHHAMEPLHLAFGATEAALMGGYMATSGSAVKDLFKGKVGLMMGGAAALLLGAVAGNAVNMAAPAKSRSLSAATSAATLLGGALLRWGIVQAGHTSATNREVTLEAMKPSKKAPGWGVSVSQ